MLLYFYHHPWRDDPIGRSHIFKMGGSTTNYRKVEVELDNGKSTMNESMYFLWEHHITLPPIIMVQ